MQFICACQWTYEVKQPDDHLTSSPLLCRVGFKWECLQDALRSGENRCWMMSDLGRERAHVQTAPLSPTDAPSQSVRDRKSVV